MDKKEALAELRNAKAYLIKWKSQIMAFAWGMPVDPKHIPLVYSDGDYSQWFYADGQAFEPLPTHHLIAPAIEECFSRASPLTVGLPAATTGAPRPYPVRRAGRRRPAAAGSASQRACAASSACIPAP